MSETVVLAPAGYELDPDLGSDPERPWRLLQGLSTRGVRIVAVARSVARAREFGPGVTLRLLPGSLPGSPVGRMIDRIRLYRYSRVVALREVTRGGVLAVHHFGPCSRYSPSLLPTLPVPLVYGPMPGGTTGSGAPYSPSEWAIWLGLPHADGRQISMGIALARLVSPIAQAMWRRTITRVDAVTVEALANVPPERPDSVVIPPGIDTQHFSPDSASRRAGRVVAVGRLVERKGLDVLIRAVGVALPQAKQLHVVLAGDGPEKNRLERLAAELGLGARITFLGRLARRELPALYRSAQVACHPALWGDTFPLAPIEAMACGLPILASNVGALPEMLGPVGLIHASRDHQALAAHLIQVMRDEKFRDELAGAARDRAVARYSLETMCDAYLRLYWSLSSRGPASAFATSD